jgi:hypothetical protein
VALRPGPVLGRRLGALGLLAILPASRERFSGHEPPSVQENQMDLLLNHYIEPELDFHYGSIIFLLN